MASPQSIITRCGKAEMKWIDEHSKKLYLLVVTVAEIEADSNIEVRQASRI
jgi:hypothetical protein